MNAPIKKTFLVGTFMQLPKYNMQSLAAGLAHQKIQLQFCHLSKFNTALAKRQDQTTSGLNKKAKLTLEIAIGLSFFMILSVNFLIVLSSKFVSPS